MPKYIFAYHGDTMAKPEEVAQVMEAWGNWFAALGEAVVDGGNPCSVSKTVSDGSVSDGGGSNPISGYTLVNADNIDAACDLVKGCPVLAHGTVEVAECMEM
ncbi:MAG: hypothetical protein GY947_22880 [Rhodobacteraceae bacterium]|nr:hypothetical protein [Paracoccaceae bacterium]